MPGYLNDRKKSSCFGYEACRQVCPASAIRMEEDEEGFRYPVVDETKCIHCGRCHQVCPYEHMPAKHTETKYAFGGYVKDWSIRTEFMSDVRTLSYEEICKKWYGGPSWKLLWQKYVWGNRQKVFLWNLIHRGNGGN